MTVRLWGGDWNKLLRLSLASLGVAVIIPALVAGVLMPGAARLLRARPVGGVVVSSQVVSRTGSQGQPRWSPRVQVRYAWGGREHTASWLDSWRDRRRREDAEAELAPWPVGTAVEVWVDPVAPTTGTQLPGFASWVAPVLVLLLAGARLLLDEWAERVARWRRARAEREGWAALDPTPLTREGFLDPRGDLWATHALPLVCAPAAWWLHATSPWLTLVGLLLVALPLGWASASFASQLAQDLRWRRARLVPADGGQPHELDLLAVPRQATPLAPRFVLRRETRASRPDSLLRRWVQDWLGNEWVPVELLQEQLLEHRRLPGQRVRLQGPSCVSPAQAIEGDPADGVEQRVRPLLLARGETLDVSFAWPTSERAR